MNKTCAVLMLFIILNFIHIIFIYAVDNKILIHFSFYKDFILFLLQMYMLVEFLPGASVFIVTIHPTLNKTSCIL